MMNITNRKIILLLLSMLMTVLSGCMVYHKPEFTGRVVDSESKQPISGAAVVVAYSKEICAFVGCGSSYINVRETLTDEDGRFRIPSYTTLISLFPFGRSWGNRAEFTIFKPGYGIFGYFPSNQTYPPPLSVQAREKYFSEGFGIEKKLIVHTPIGYEVTDNLKLGIVELPKLKTREEIRKNLPSPVDGGYYQRSWFLKKQKQFIQLINEENRSLGYHEYKIE